MICEIRAERLAAGSIGQKSGRAVSLLTGYDPNARAPGTAPIEIDLFSLRMQLDRRINLGLASHARARVRTCVYAHARSTRMFTEYVDPLSSRRRVTQRVRVRARQSSFTPICLRSPGMIQLRQLLAAPFRVRVLQKEHCCRAIENY